MELADGFEGKDRIVCFICEQIHVKSIRIHFFLWESASICWLILQMPNTVGVGPCRSQPILFMFCMNNVNLSIWTITNCLPGSSLAGNWRQELEQNIECRHSNVGVRVLATRPNACLQIVLTLRGWGWDGPAWDLFFLPISVDTTNMVNKSGLEVIILSNQHIDCAQSGCGRNGPDSERIYLQNEERLGPKSSGQRF